MFLRTDKPTRLESSINKSFVGIRKELLDIHYKEFSETDIRGKSKQHLVAANYQRAIMLVVLVWLNVERLIGNPKFSQWSYYVDKYNLKILKECLACNGVSLDNILNDFDLPTVNGEEPQLEIAGIETMGIEESFEIEPQSTPIVLAVPSGDISDTIDVLEAFENTFECDELTCKI